MAPFILLEGVNKSSQLSLGVNKHKMKKEKKKKKIRNESAPLVRDFDIWA